MSVDISIIIPIYNVEPYLTACLQSVVEQSFKGGIQAILVNDCSTDESEIICHTYLKKYPDLFEYYKLPKNAGVSSARNKALDCINGEYFTFVDSDDELATSALDSLYANITTTHSDIAIGNHQVKKNNLIANSRKKISKKATLTGADVFNCYLQHDRLRGHPWGKIFRTETFKEIRMNTDLKMSEDFLFNAYTFSKASKISFTDESVYIYRQREGSAKTKLFTKDYYIDWLKAVEACSELCPSRQVKHLKQLQIRTLFELSKELTKSKPSNKKDVLDQILAKEEKWFGNNNFKTYYYFKDLKCLFRLLKYKKLIKSLKLKNTFSE